MSKLRPIAHPHFGNRKVAISKTVPNKPITYLHNDGNFYEYPFSGLHCPKSFANNREAVVYTRVNL